MTMRAIGRAAGFLATRLQSAADFCVDVRTFATTNTRWDVIRARRRAFFPNPEMR